MNTLAEQPPRNRYQEVVNRRLRYTNDTATWLAESLNGSMRSNFEFEFDGVELHGKDGQDLRSIFDDSIADAQLMASRNSSLFFELRRRVIERGELADMEALVAQDLQTEDGRLANTMVVISDFPEELMNRKKDEGGYNVNRRQTMLRVIQYRGDKIQLTIQSLDGSQRRALEAIYTSLDRQPKPGELLGQRINLDTDMEGSDLADHLRGVYDKNMSEQFGGRWQAGIASDEGRRPLDTYQFACAQTDLIEWFVKAKLADPKNSEKLRLKIAATVEGRYERQVSRLKTVNMVPGLIDSQQLISYNSIVGAQALMMEMAREEKRAIRLNKTYSGCGGTVEAADETGNLSTSNQLTEAGYGNQAGHDKFGPLTFECTVGHKNTRPRNILIKTCCIKDCKGKVAC